MLNTLLRKKIGNGAKGVVSVKMLALFWKIWPKIAIETDFGNQFLKFWEKSTFFPKKDVKNKFSESPRKQVKIFLSGSKFSVGELCLTLFEVGVSCA